MRRLATASIIVATTAAAGQSIPYAVIAQQGQTYGDNQTLGPIDAFCVPIISEDGAVVFRTPNNRRIYWHDTVSLHELARQGDASPDGDGTFFEFNFPGVTFSGDDVVFFALLQNSASTIGYFRANPSSGISKVARLGDPVAGGVISGFEIPRDRHAGSFGTEAIAFTAFVTGVPGVNPPPFHRSVLRAENGGLTLLTGSGLNLPGVGTIFGIPQSSQSAVINASGQVAVVANGGILRLDGPGSGVALALPGMTIANTGEMFTGNLQELFAMNDSGQVVFAGGTSSIFTSLLIADDVSIREIVSADDQTPDGLFYNAILSSDSPDLNNAGQIAFRTILGVAPTGSTGGPAALFFVDDRIIIEVARVGAPTPDGLGVFTEVDDPMFNEAGQLAFRAAISVQGVGREAISRSIQRPVCSR